MWEKVWKYKIIMLSLVAIILSLFVVYLNSKYLNDNILVENIAFTVMISFSTGIVSELFLKRDMINCILEKMKLKQNLDDTGLEYISCSFNDIDFHKYIKEARDNIDIIHMYGLTWLNSNFQYVKKYAIENGCKVRVVLLDPESKMIESIIESYSKEDNDGTKAIEQNKIKDKLQEAIKMIENSRAELYFHKGPFYNAIYRIDNRVIIVQKEMTSEKDIEMPVFVFKKKDGKNCVFEKYIREIEEIIEYDK